MRKGGGKQKGNSFERLICRQLSLWITHGKKEDCFWRSAMSGGRATVHKRKGTTIRQSGDICAVSPEGHVLTDAWFIECKHYKKLDVASFLIKNTGQLAKFWSVACKQAKSHGKTPMLIVKENNAPILVLTKHGAMIHTSPITTSHIGYCDFSLFSNMTSSDFTGEV